VGVSNRKSWKRKIRKEKKKKKGMAVAGKSTLGCEGSVIDPSVVKCYNWERFPLEHQTNKAL
jgi:hypothetical protein